jgi:hypothetical protein
MSGIAFHGFPTVVVSLVPPAAPMAWLRQQSPSISLLSPTFVAILTRPAVSRAFLALARLPCTTPLSRRALFRPLSAHGLRG